MSAAILTTEDARVRLSLKTTSAVRRLCLAGRIVGEKAGRDWRISEAEVERYARERKGVGRPRKERVG